MVPTMTDIIINLGPFIRYRVLPQLHVRQFEVWQEGEWLENQDWFSIAVAAKAQGRVKRLRQALKKLSKAMRRERRSEGWPGMKPWPIGRKEEGKLTKRLIALALAPGLYHQREIELAQILSKDFTGMMGSWLPRGMRGHG